MAVRKIWHFNGQQKITTDPRYLYRYGNKDKIGISLYPSKNDWGFHSISAGNGGNKKNGNDASDIGYFRQGFTCISGGNYISSLVTKWKETIFTFFGASSHTLLGSRRERSFGLLYRWQHCLYLTDDFAGGQQRIAVCLTLCIAMDVFGVKAVDDRRTLPLLI